MPEKFEQKPLNLGDALKEAEELRTSLGEKHPGQKGSFSGGQYDLEDELLDIKRREAVPHKGEIKLTPEVIEKIMTKVQDIDAKGTAYSNIAAIWKSNRLAKEAEQKTRDWPTKGKTRVQVEQEIWEMWNSLPEREKEAFEEDWRKELFNIRRILNRGLLGLNYEDDDRLDREGFIDKALTSYEKNRSPEGGKNVFVHFNITGRGGHEKKYFSIGKTEIASSHWISPNSIALLFDIESFDELPGEGKESSIYRNKDKIIEGKKYQHNDPQLFGLYEEMKKAQGRDLTREDLRNKKGYMVGSFNEEGRPVPTSEYGFVLTPSIKPTSFRGIVIDLISLREKDFIDADRVVDDLGNLLLRTYGHTPELLIPIYDTDGNLVWPKRKSHEQIVEELKNQTSPQ